METLRQQVGEAFFEERVRPSLAILELELKANPRGTVFLSFNGGKDCTALLELTERTQLLSNYAVQIVVFEEEDPFEELTAFTRERLANLQVHWCSSDMKNELAMLAKAQGLRSVLLGQRSTDPACPQRVREPSSIGWPFFIRVCPVLQWTYSDVWHFLRTTQSKYCSLYDQGYSSLGARSKTMPNPLLKGRPAYLLSDETTERTGR